MGAEIVAPTTRRLLELIEGMAGQPVVMLVDLVVDRFITGTPKRISREAPVLILHYDQETLAPGGGANAVANVAALGGRPLPVGLVGDDASGDYLREHFDGLGVATHGIVTRPGFRTPTKTRVLAGARHAIKQQIVRFDVEDELSLDDAERDALLAVLDQLADPPRVAVLSDYGYGSVDPRSLPALRRTLGASCTILADSRYRIADFAGIDGATPNSEEAESLLGRAFDATTEKLERGGRELLAKLGARFLLITQGSDGMALFTGDGTAQLEVHGTDQVADVTGAGDTVIGTFALALASGASPLEAACLANYAGGVVVMKSGTATLTRGELVEAVESDAKPLQAMRWTAA